MYKEAKQQLDVAAGGASDEVCCGGVFLVSAALRGPLCVLRSQSGTTHCRHFVLGFSSATKAAQRKQNLSATNQPSESSRCQRHTSIYCMGGRRPDNRIAPSPKRPPKYSTPVKPGYELSELVGIFILTNSSSTVAI